MPKRLRGWRFGRHWPLKILVVYSAVVVSLPAQDRHDAKTYPRAKSPRFDPEEARSIFFDNAFSKLIGERPKSAPTGASATPSVAAAPEATPAGESRSKWSAIISPTTIEDEIKSLKQSIDAAVTTPADFAGRGHKAARRDFSLLAVLFAVIDQHEGQVRWKPDAAAARDLFSRIAANAKAGGSPQVYSEAKARKQDLDDLVRGSSLQSKPPDGEGGWGHVADRAPLMDLLEKRIEANLKQWTASKDEFAKHKSELLHEAELLSLIGEVLQQDGMDDASDPAYVKLAQQLVAGGRTVVQSVQQGSDDAARQAVGKIGQTCATCHDTYR